MRSSPSEPRTGRDSVQKLYCKTISRFSPLKGPKITFKPYQLLLSYHSLVSVQLVCPSFAELDDAGEA
jgi:hypothetical protein